VRTWTHVGVATLLGAVFVGVLRVPGVSDLAILLVSNGGQLLAAALAALGCAVAARRMTEHRRTAWCWLSAGCGSWAAGQAMWSYYEVVLDREVPFPSLADVGFVGFPLLAAVGLVIWLGTQSDQMAARGRDLMDGAIIAVSLLVLSWVTARARWWPRALTHGSPSPCRSPTRSATWSSPRWSCWLWPADA
jgi:hypothetical protein